VEIIHESLLRKWDVLRELIQTNRTMLQQRERFKVHLQAWHDSGKQDDHLLQGIQLSEAEALDEQALVHMLDGQELIKRSKLQRDRSRQRSIRTQRGIIAVLLCLLLLALGAVAVAIDRQQAAVAAAERAEQERDITISRQLALQADARSRDAEYDTALLLSVQAANIAETQNAENALRTSLRYAPQRYLQRHTSSVTSIAFSPDGDILASGSSDATIKLWDVASGQLQATLEGHTSAVESVAFSPDGQTLASHQAFNSANTTIKLWDVVTGQLQTTL
jgi:predicted NACHT family NTPase